RRPAWCRRRSRTRCRESRPLRSETRRRRFSHLLGPALSADRNSAKRVHQGWEVVQLLALEGKYDLSDRLSLIQVSGRLNSFVHRKCPVHYCPVLRLTGQSHHVIKVLRRALRWHQEDVEPDDRGRLRDKIEGINCQGRSRTVAEVNKPP